MLTIFGVAMAITMVASYALEARSSWWIAVFAVGCAGTSIYALLTEAWIFAALEAIWAAIAVVRFRTVERAPSSIPAH